MDSINKVPEAEEERMGVFLEVRDVNLNRDGPAEYEVAVKGLDTAHCDWLSRLEEHRLGKIRR